MSRYKYKQLRGTKAEEFIDDSKIQEIRDKIKKKKRIFGILIEIEYKDMTIQEITYFKESLEVFYISVKKTNVPLDDIYRMYSINEKQYKHLVENEEYHIKEIHKYMEINKDKTNQEESKVFTESYVQKELEENEEDMYYMFKCLLSPEDLCEYFRIFPVETAWYKFMRKLQKRIRHDFEKDLIEYRKRCGEAGKPFLNETEEDKRLYQLDNFIKHFHNEIKNKSMKTLQRNARKEEMKKRKEKFLGEKIEDNQTLKVEGTELKIWGI